MTDEGKSRRAWLAWIWRGLLLLWIGGFLYRRVWPTVWPVLASGGKHGLPELWNLLGFPLLGLAATVLAWGLIRALWIRLSDRERVRMIWMASALPALALPLTISVPEAQAALSNLQRGAPAGLALELILFAPLAGFAYAFTYAGMELQGWRRNLTCLGVATSAWCLMWIAMASVGPAGGGHDLGSILLIAGPVVIAWGVALAYWRIDLDAKRAAS